MTRGEARDRTICMMRVRNEAKYIARSLARTWQVARTVVLFDDGSTDDTWSLAVDSVNPGGIIFVNSPYDKNIKVCEDKAERASCSLHLLPSPFRTETTRAGFEVSEVRDKQFLWEYCKSQLDFDYVLCLDGDEVLSRLALREWPRVIGALAHEVDVLHLPFVYLWDSETTQRVDGSYGYTPEGGRRFAYLRAFTVTRLSPLQYFKTGFAYAQTGRAGFHAGSVPLGEFVVNGGYPRAGSLGYDFDAFVMHYGYLDAEQRQRKYEFYNFLDPGNTYEGEYAHIIGKPSQWAPGPVQLAPWEDV